MPEKITTKDIYKSATASRRESMGVILRESGANLMHI
jgi:hypothetical protein